MRGYGLSVQAVWARALEPRLKRLFTRRSCSCRDNVDMNASRRTTLLAWLLAAAGAGVGAVAWADNDQDSARAAVQAGQVLPLKTLLDRLEREYPGQVVELELEQHHGRWIYEVKVLQAGGRLVKVKLDAASGQVLSRRDREGARR